MKETSIHCPHCGALMNRHAEKVDYSRNPDEFDDPVFDGVLVEFHTCPVCRYVEERTAS